MINIDLQSDEVLLLNEDSGKLDKKNGELILTNKRIIWAKTTAFGGKIKEMKELPLREIKLHNGEPQVKVVGQLMNPELQIQHARGISTIHFLNNRKATKAWASEIYKAMTGQEAPSDSAGMGNLAIPGMDILGKGIKDSVGSFAEGLGVKDALRKGKSISTECSTCGAPLSGMKGDTVTCEYCGSKQVLK